MPATISRRKLFEHEGVVLEQELVSGTAVTDPVLLAADVIAQVTGVNPEATAHYLVERSTRDPALGTPNWAQVVVSTGGKLGYMLLSGDGGVKQFREPAAAWYRVRLTSIDNGPVLATLSGRGARVGIA